MIKCKWLNTNENYRVGKCLLEYCSRFVPMDVSMNWSNNADQKSADDIWWSRLHTCIRLWLYANRSQVLFTVETIKLFENLHSSCWSNAFLLNVYLKIAFNWYARIKSDCWTVIWYNCTVYLLLYMCITHT